jgi:hypothetical protein
MSEQIKNAAIQQLNISYVAIEDRLLLRIGVANQAELPVWLTRRAAKQLAVVLHNIPMSVPSDPRINAPYTQEVEQRFAKEEILQKLNFSKAYEERNSLNLGQLFLVGECRITQSNNQRVLDLLCSNQQTVSVVLNDELILAISSMLQHACQQAAWDFAFSEQTLLFRSNNSTTLLH